ncbi:MAG: hypothetical protein AAB426_12465 [Myxococcota bacterium]
MSPHPRTLIAWSLLVVVASCARHPVPVAAPRPQELAGIIAHLDRTRVRVQSFTAEARVTSFGPEGRRRVTVVLAAARPQSLSYQVLGPHGAVLEAFATDGVEMQLFDTTTRAFRYGPATPDHLATLLGSLALRQRAADWVGLFFGDIDIPEQATLVAQSDGDMRVRWLDAELEHTVRLDAQTLRPVELAVGRPREPPSRVRITARDDTGLPSTLVIDSPDPARETRIELRDLAIDPALDPQTFRLDPPSGALLERLVP